MTDGKPLFVFVHGFLGFVRLPVPLVDVRYFRKIPELMDQLGARYALVKVPAIKGVVARATALAWTLAALGDGPVVLVGHSMGGLDARYLAAHLDPRRRVRAVVTVGTPHRGSPIADALLRGEFAWMQPLARLWRPALADLSLPSCAAFNEAVPDRADVRYVSFAASRPVPELFAPLRPFASCFGQQDHDGQVALESAAWGDCRAPVRADHFELIGWSLAAADAAVARPFPHLDLYRGIVSEFS